MSVSPARTVRLASVKIGACNYYFHRQAHRLRIESGSRIVHGGMHITVNGEAKDVDVATVDALLDALRFPRERVAVERNGAIVTKGERAHTPVQEGDVLEIVTLVGGG